MLPDQIVQPVQPIQPISTGISEADTLMNQLHKVLSAEPVGTYYQPSNVVRPDITAAGGVVPTVRRYRVIADKIMVPYKDETGPTVGRDQFLSGDVTEADLHAAGCNIPYLVAAGHIVEDGYIRV